MIRKTMWKNKMLRTLAQQYCSSSTIVTLTKSWSEANVKIDKAPRGIYFNCMLNHLTIAPNTLLKGHSHGICSPLVYSYEKVLPGP
jgi:hypothetical protein